RLAVRGGRTPAGTILAPLANSPAPICLAESFPRFRTFRQPCGRCRGLAWPPGETGRLLAAFARTQPDIFADCGALSRQTGDLSTVALASPLEIATLGASAEVGTIGPSLADRLLTSPLGARKECRYDTRTPRSRCAKATLRTL